MNTGLILILIWIGLAISAAYVNFQWKQRKQRTRR